MAALYFILLTIISITVSGSSKEYGDSPNTLACPRSPECKDKITNDQLRCNHDDECPGEFICCYHGCFFHKICAKPAEVSLNVDKCPPVGSKCKKKYSLQRFSVLKCTDSRDCKEGMTCCSDPCSDYKICKPVYSDPSENFPKFPTPEPSSSSPKECPKVGRKCLHRHSRSIFKKFKCSSDSDCTSGSMCCDDPCPPHKICKGIDNAAFINEEQVEKVDQPVLKHEKVCPTIRECPHEKLVNNDFLCNADEDCSKLLKCCENGCFEHKVCSFPVLTHLRTLNENNPDQEEYFYEDYGEINFDVDEYNKEYYEAYKQLNETDVPKEQCYVIERCLQNPVNNLDLLCSDNKPCPSGYKCCHHPCYLHQTCVKPVEMKDDVKNSVFIKLAEGTDDDDSSTEIGSNNGNEYDYYEYNPYHNDYEDNGYDNRVGNNHESDYNYDNYVNYDENLYNYEDYKDIELGERREDEQNETEEETERKYEDRNEEDDYVNEYDYENEYDDENEIYDKNEDNYENEYDDDNKEYEEELDDDENKNDYENEEQEAEPDDDENKNDYENEEQEAEPDDDENKNDYENEEYEVDNDDENKDDQEEDDHKSGHEKDYSEEKNREEKNFERDEAELEGSGGSPERDDTFEDNEDLFLDGDDTEENISDPSQENSYGSNKNKIVIFILPQGEVLNEEEIGRKILQVPFDVESLDEILVDEVGSMEIVLKKVTKSKE